MRQQAPKKIEKTKHTTIKTKGKNKSTKQVNCSAKLQTKDSRNHTVPDKTTEKILQKSDSP